MFASLLTTMQRFKIPSVICTTVPTASDRLHSYNFSKQHHIQFENNALSKLKKLPVIRIEDILKAFPNKPELCRDIVTIMANENTPSNYIQPEAVRDLYKILKTAKTSEKKLAIKLQLSGFF